MLVKMECFSTWLLLDIEIYIWWLLRPNIYQAAKNSKTIDLNVTQMILFKSPRDVEQIGVLGRQLGDRKLLLEAYKRATRKPFAHLMIDLDPQTDQKLKYCSNCSGSQPSVFLYLYNSNKRDIEWWVNATFLLLSFSVKLNQFWNSLSFYTVPLSWLSFSVTVCLMLYMVELEWLRTYRLKNWRGISPILKHFVERNVGLGESVNF